MITQAWTGDCRDPIQLEFHGSPLAWSYPAHRHADHWEVVFVRLGTLRHTVDGQTVEQPPGSLTILRERDWHALAGCGVELVNLSFTSAFIRAFEQLPHRDGGALGWALDHPQPLWCQVPVAERPRWEARLDRLGAIIGGPEEVPCLLSILADALLACYQAHHRLVDATPPPPGWLAPLQALAHDQEQDLPDLAGLRRLAGVSREHLARVVRRHLGVSPSQFLNRCRSMRLAHLLLAEPTRSVGELAQAAGFASLTYGARCFRKVYGQAPLDWRRQQQSYLLTEARQGERFRERIPGARRAPGLRKGR